MSLKPFDVVVVPFPYSDRLSEKRRPALVVSVEAMADRLGLVWVAMITTAARAGLGDCPISDLDAAGLPSPSILRASKVATIDADRVIRTVGGLSAEDREAATGALRGCAGF